MAKNKKTTYLGTTKKLPYQNTAKKQPKTVSGGCLFTFNYRARDGRDPSPFIIMVSGRWKADNGGTYFNGVNLKTLGATARARIILEFGGLPVGSVSYNDIQAVAGQDPECCIRTYNVRKVRALHKVRN
tara:strand:- start:311 stop:697 length:387 start_codon:yes stop_codon:yes gene_type:complete